MTRRRRQTGTAADVVNNVFFFFSPAYLTGDGGAASLAGGGSTAARPLRRRSECVGRRQKRRVIRNRKIGRTRGVETETSWRKIVIVRAVLAALRAGDQWRGREGGVDREWGQLPRSAAAPTPRKPTKPVPQPFYFSVSYGTVAVP